MQPAMIVRRVGGHVRSRGLAPVVVDCATWAFRWATVRPRAWRPSGATFRFDDVEHRYLRHPYNWTWLNERAVEVPLAAAVLAGSGAARVLEVGHVLGHYQPVSHTVVDKYERAAGVVNADVADLELPGPYDLILAVSTLEHVGLDEEVQDPDKPARAIERLASLLAPGGRLWCSIPVGYNASLDRQLQEGRCGFSRLTALRRLGPSNRWEQVPVEEVWGTPYDRLLYTAQAIVVAELQR